MNVQEALRLVPERPGVYLYRDETGMLLYVGKARSLRSRVRSYFQSPEGLTTKVFTMVQKITDVEFITTDSEMEALLLESNLIKEHRPKYNVLLKDDKAYPYLKIVHERYPRLMMVRQKKEKDGRYFGPFPSAGAVSETLRLVRKLFPLRTCTPNKFKTAELSRPCLLFHIGRCVAPCRKGQVSDAEYDEVVLHVSQFLQGKHDEVIRSLRKRMEAHAVQLQFEAASQIRDQLKAIAAITEKQSVNLQQMIDMDVWAHIEEKGIGMAQALLVREGRIVGHKRLRYQIGLEEGGSLWSTVLRQHYTAQEAIPKLMLLDARPDDAEILSQWLSELRGDRVDLFVPSRGEKRKLLGIAEENARMGLQEELERRGQDAARSEAALGQLQVALSLARKPMRMECFDISTFQGTETVASMVVFLEGKPLAEQYRRFRMKTVVGQDDFASMKEAISRRFRRGLKEQAEGLTSGFAHFPDLLIIDGGKGQLGAARAVMKELGVDYIPTFGLAKQEEELFYEGGAESILLPRDSQALYLVQAIRDEAHRFAITYHRNLRSKRVLHSRLDDIEGIGPVRKKALLVRFGSLDGIRRASLAEIAEIPGLNLFLAERIKEGLGGPT